MYRIRTSRGLSCVCCICISQVEMELAGFKATLGVESEAYTKKASFFKNYNWRDVRCGSCKRHLGYELLL